MLDVIYEDEAILVAAKRPAGCRLPRRRRAEIPCWDR